PSRGSLGTSDLIILMSMAAVAIGRGDAYFEGKIQPAREALAKAGLAPVQLGAKDGLAIGSASSVTLATAALALEQIRSLLLVHFGAASLALEGYGANPRAFDPRLAQARPAARQEAAAVAFSQALAGSSLHDAPRQVQDAISFRTLPQVTGVVLDSYLAACAAVETELNGVSDNPLVLPAEGEMHSVANFHTPAIALAFDALAIAMTHLATASAYRSIKLMTGRMTGLPNYLSPVGGASAGFVPMQKALAALHAEVRLKATPASLDGLAVSDTVEDLAPQTALCIRKLAEQADLVAWMLAMEAMFAAQAVSLRQASGSPHRLGGAGQFMQGVIRAAVPSLEEDRETGPDAAVLRDVLFRPDVIEGLERLFSQMLPELQQS
ncbi:MAG TPA: aromatic amino acid lyase, partial [Tianweitania sediminis]|nr:aromatic amino acid lyase [Tianweitania sediminis]